jgi:NAD(P)-dependent dehydrogenase (short-subunit alcohol dehydrogenase family)
MRACGLAQRRGRGGRRFSDVTSGVVVTGASTGIGACCARYLAGRGFRVFGTVRRPEDDAALAAAGVTPVRMDVTDGASIVRARAEVERALAGAPLAGLVNNAGIPAAGPLELVALDELRRVLEVNLVGAVAVTQAFLPLLRACRGRIVNMSSVAGLSALPFMGPYAASKFALEAVSDSLRRELLPFGVRVIVIEPGSFQTKIWSKVEAMDLSRYRDSPYGDAFLRFGRAALRGAAQARPPDKVARAVGRALTARRPPLRIVVPPHPLARLALWIPDRWLDWLIDRFLWRRSVTPPAPAPPTGSARSVRPRSAPHSRES